MRSVLCYSVFDGGLMRKKENNRGKTIATALSCLLIFTGCGADVENHVDAGPENTDRPVAADDNGTQQNEEMAGLVELPIQEERKLTETDQRILKSIVQIQAGDLQGSGVIYEEDEDLLMLVTASHVLAHDNGEIQVTFPDGMQVMASKSETVTDRDLAFLCVDKTELSQETWKSCLPVQTDREVFDSLEEYEDVWMYGGESGEPVYAFVVDPWIYVEDFDEHMLLLQGLMVPGMSGGGAFTEDGVFLGILCGADEEGKVAVVPYSIIEAEKPAQPGRLTFYSFEDAPLIISACHGCVCEHPHSGIRALWRS